ncbi:Uncharacterised protein [Staphylococcus aureus]|nr:Uncharacterised protein [Staphylococcus aureus]
MKQWKSLIQEIKIDSKESEYKNMLYLDLIKIKNIDQ